MNVSFTLATTAGVCVAATRHLEQGKGHGWRGGKHASGQARGGRGGAKSNDTRRNKRTHSFLAITGKEKIAMIQKQLETKKVRTSSQGKEHPEAEDISTSKAEAGHVSPK